MRHRRGGSKNRGAAQKGGSQKAHAAQKGSLKRELAAKNSDGRKKEVLHITKEARGARSVVTKRSLRHKQQGSTFCLQTKWAREIFTSGGPSRKGASGAVVQPRWQDPSGVKKVRSPLVVSNKTANGGMTRGGTFCTSTTNGAVLLFFWNWVFVKLL